MITEDHNTKAPPCIEPFKGFDPEACGRAALKSQENTQGHIRGLVGYAKKLELDKQELEHKLYELEEWQTWIRENNKLSCDKGHTLPRKFDA